MSHVVTGMKLTMHSCLCTEINGKHKIGSSQTTINKQESIKRLPSALMKDKWDFASHDGTEMHSVKCYFSTCHDVKRCNIQCGDSFANNERLRLSKGHGLGLVVVCCFECMKQMFCSQSMFHVKLKQDRLIACSVPNLHFRQNVNKLEGCRKRIIQHLGMEKHR